MEKECVMPDIDFQEYAKVFKAISEPKRLQILFMLSSGEMCACRILEKFHITQPTLSHNMRLLSEAGLVDIRKEGKWCYYSLNLQRIASLEQLLNGIREHDVSQSPLSCRKNCQSGD